MVLNKKVGRFYISMEKIHCLQDKVLDVLANVIVVDARYDYARHAIEYIGISDKFKVVPAGESAILYEIDWEYCKFKVTTN